MTAMRSEPETAPRPSYGEFAGACAGAPLGTGDRVVVAASRGVR
jgi:hypothetical protein